MVFLDKVFFEKVKFEKIQSADDLNHEILFKVNTEDLPIFSSPLMKEIRSI